MHASSIKVKILPQEHKIVNSILLNLNITSSKVYIIKAKKKSMLQKCMPNGIFSNTGYFLVHDIYMKNIQKNKNLILKIIAYLLKLWNV